MTRLLICGVSAFALSLGVTGGAQAQSLLQTLQGGSNDLLDHMAEFDEGNWTNFAVNSAPINASVNATGGVADTTTDIAVSASGELDVDGLSDISAEGSVAGHYKEELEAFSVDLGDVETMAAGAVNTGDIASAPVEAFEGELEIESDSMATEGGWGKGGTSFAEASYELEGELESFSGPADDVFAANFAYNNAPINASVDLGPLANASSISTMAAGAINTGTISMGFDGSAFNSAVNGDE